jgi:hypothetical protein
VAGFLCVGSLNGLRLRCRRAHIALNPRGEITLTVFDESPEAYPPRPCSCHPMAFKRPYRQAENVCGLLLIEKDIHWNLLVTSSRVQVGGSNFAGKMLTKFAAYIPASLASGGPAGVRQRGRLPVLRSVSQAPAGRALARVGLSSGDTQVIPEVHRLISSRPEGFEFAGWGARTRTWEWRNQNPLPYHLATPHQAAFYAAAARGP